jgi:hypothetical protein
MYWLKFDIKFGNRIYPKEKRRERLFSFEYNLLPKLISNYYAIPGIRVSDVNGFFILFIGCFTPFKSRDFAKEFSDNSIFMKPYHKVVRETFFILIFFMALSNMCN